jgi:hypothetical protein
MQWFKDKRIKWQTLVNKTPYKNNNWTTRTQETKSCSKPLLLAALVENSFSTVGRTLLTMREIQQSNPNRDIAFFGSKTCSTVTLAHFLRIFLI